MLIRFIKDFYTGLRSIFEAIVLIFEHWLWLFFVFPVLFSLGIFFGGEHLFEELKKINLQSSIRNLEFKADFYNIRFEGFPTDSEEMGLLIIAVKLILVVVSLKLSKYIILILMAPIMTILSSRTEFLLTGNKYPFSINQFVSDIYRGINFAVRNLFRQMVIIIGWYLLTLVIPFLDQFTFWIVFFVGSFYYGASMMDYTNERRRMSMHESIVFIRRHAGITMAIGMLFYTLFFVTYIGIVFAPVICIIAATYAIHQRVDLSKNKNAVKSETKSKEQPENEEDDWANG